MTDYQFAVVMWWLTFVALFAIDAAKPRVQSQIKWWVVFKVFALAEFMLMNFRVTRHFLQGYFG